MEMHFITQNISAYRDFDEEDPTEVEADKFDLNYIKLDGNVGYGQWGWSCNGNDGHY